MARMLHDREKPMTFEPVLLSRTQTPRQRYGTISFRTPRVGPGGLKDSDVVAVADLDSWGGAVDDKIERAIAPPCALHSPRGSSDQISSRINNGRGRGQQQEIISGQILRVDGLGRGQRELAERSEAHGRRRDGFGENKADVVLARSHEGNRHPRGVDQ